MTFVATNKAPGVYIDEIQIPGPIAPAGTSTAAFVGPAKSGPLYQPVFLTNAQQFVDTFGAYIEDPIRVYAAHAVNGFFNENGTTCYFVRVGTGVQASLALKDRNTVNAKPTLVVTALLEGVAGNGITVTVDDASINSTARVVDGQGPISAPASINSATNTGVVLANAADAARFSAGDWIVVEQPGPPVQSERAQVASIAGAAITLKAALANAYGAGTIRLPGNQIELASATDAAKFMPGDTVVVEQAGPPAISETAQVASTRGARLIFAADLTNSYTGGDVHIADLAAGQTRIRLTDVTGMEPGSCLSVGPDPANPADGEVAEDVVVRTVDTITKSVTLTQGLAAAHKLDRAAPAVVTAKTLEFKLTITSASAGAEVFDKLAMDPRHSRYFAKVVNSQVVTVTLADPPTSTPPSKNRPLVIAATNLASGAADDVKSITAANYHKAIDTLLRVPDVNLLCIPDAVGGNFSAADTQDIQSYMIAHCEKVVNRFAILDSVSSANTDISKVVAQRNNLNSERGMASLYFPWIKISNPLGSGRVSVPPSGHIAGVFANNDNTRGVFKAPANEPVTMALDLEDVVTDDVQGPLNEQGVNVIRAFPGRGILVWGARTLAPSDVTQWRYNSIRRFVNFVEASLRDDTRFAVFEPNNPTLWATIQRLVKDFLTTQWNNGALEGVKAEDGFSVRIDAQLNPPDVIALGQLIIEVKLYTVPPAEFVVFRIIQQPGGPSVTESV
ncbi:MULTISPECIES: phage tail sheath subtilisin-like domain-containing protein [unclassified Burkholderia]|uniref:phage tail sheath subtilisin-like domain-containing protein n=1 Tax=unclassified Burkholderia TaxID=2613784 RepID=UPI001424496D|nr:MULTISPECIES: phage tail sheath subtilisin-like domain-containing protein [unclassified Burkholderia]NIE58653.1 phage tail sheath family protein [Burkholderia sp. Ap-955]NIF10146.1 phage tail sheath family protein [Burkholderia sp. Ax-1735]NIG03597.1 phage tail sheath family protein [Burkholderia sp. Tr-849]